MQIQKTLKKFIVPYMIRVAEKQNEERIFQHNRFGTCCKSLAIPMYWTFYQRQAKAQLKFIGDLFKRYESKTKCTI